MNLQKECCAIGLNDDGQTSVPAPNTNFIALAGGGNHSLGLKADGTIIAWGLNDDGQASVSAPNTNFIALAAGGYHSLGLKADGTIIAWGWNIFGQINVPVPNTNFIAVAGGREHSLGLKSDGTIVAWGWDAYGQASVPAPNTNFIAVAGGGWHSLGLKADGTIIAWGLNTDGQTSVPAPNTNFIAVAAGGGHSLGLKVDGTIVAWGRNDDGQTTVPVPNTNFIAVAAGQFHSLGLKSDGTIVAWGANADGQTTVPAPNADFGVDLNSGVEPDSGSAAGGYPVVINGTGLGDGSDITNVTLCGASVSSIDSQSATQVVVTAAVGPAGLGDVRVFSTSQGETVKSNAFTYVIADQTITFPAIAPQPVAGAVGLSATASSGLTVTFAVGSGPGSIAGGSNLTFSAVGEVEIVASQAGNASYNAATDVTNLVKVFAMTSRSGPAVGGNSITIANGALGNGSDITNVTVGGVAAVITGQGADWVGLTLPSGPSGLVPIIIQSTTEGETTLPNAYTYNPAGEINRNRRLPGPTIAAGWYHSLGLRWGGTIIGWGRNDDGQTSVPAPNTNFIALAGGGNHSLGLKTDGTIIAWGLNTDGQASVSAPNTNFIALAAGGYHSLGLKADGTIIAWGWNIFGQINVPAPNTNFIAVSGGREHSLGLKSDGTIVAWGWDAYGQASVPAPNMNFIAVAAGGWHSLGLKADGTIVGWGYNSDGQTSVPVPNTNFMAVAAGGNHSLGLKTDGTIIGWGRSSEGQTDVPAPNTDFIAVAAGGNHSLGLKSDGTIIAWGQNADGQTNVPPPNADFGVSLNSGVAPDSGSATGGYPVVIIGTDLGDGSDIFNVTLCGAPVSSIDSQSATQIVVTAGMGAAGLGDVRVFSTSHGETVKSNVFTYVIADQTITFPAIAPQHVSDSMSLAATASSGLPVTFAIIDGPGILTGSNLTFSAAGTVVVVGSQAGNATWDTAVPVTNRVSVYALSSSSGPYAGGNSVTVTNGHFGSITNVLVGRSATGFQPAMLTASGDAWFTVVMPGLAAAGAMDIVIQTSDNGEITLAGAYTVNPAGWIWDNGLVAGGPYLSAGESFSLGLKADGTVVGWGANSEGQTTVPAPNSHFVAVAAGNEEHALGLKAVGTVVAWGTNTYGQMDVPAPNSNFVAVAAGRYHSLGLKADGMIVGWGINDHGQTAVPAPNSDFVVVAAGYNHSLGLKADGTVVGWGPNSYGQTDVPAPNSDFMAVAAGYYHSLGLKADGTVVAWGYNAYGQADVPAPNSHFVAVAGGARHSLGLKADGTVVAWGANTYGQTDVPAPNSNFVAVAAGGFHSLGLKADGTVVAWGRNEAGQATVPAPNTNFGLFAYGVLPQRGLSSGGFPVVISGRDLGDGSDITNVTLCGTSVSSIDSQSATQIVVTAAAGAVGLGDVRVFSTSHGETVKSNAFTYVIADQTITFPAIADQLATNAVGLAATASSGLAVTFTVGSGPASITGGSNLTFSSSGVVRIVASQAGNASYNAAPDVTNTFNVTKAAATVTLGDLAQPYDGTPKSATATTVPVGLAVDLTYDGSPTAPTDAGSYAVTGTVNEATYEGSATGTLTIAKAVATVTLGDLAQTYDGTPKSASATTVPVGLAVDLTYDGSPTAPTDAGSYAVTGTVNEANYEGSATGTLTMAKVDQVLMNFLPADGAQFILGQNATLSAQASSGLPVGFTNLTPEIALLSGTDITFTNSGLARVQAFQAGDVNWNAAPSVTHEWRVGGLITNVAPAAANVGGGIEVVVQGRWLGNGLDITNVALAGVVATIVTQSQHEVTVMAGAATAAVTGDVTVASATGGYMALSNAFEYLWLDAPVQRDPIDITPSNLVARWELVPAASRHVLDVGTDTNFMGYVPGYEKLNVALAEQYPVEGLTVDTWYALRVFAWNASGYSLPSRTVWVPAGNNTPYETHPPMAGPVSQGAIMNHALSNMFHGTGLVYAAWSSDSNVMQVAVGLDGHLEMNPVGPGTAVITVTATDPATGYTSTITFTVEVVGTPALVLDEFVPREAWNLRFTQTLELRNDAGVDAIGVRVLFTNLMAGIIVENKTGTATDGRPMIEMQTAFTNGATLTLNIVYLCTEAYRVDEYPPVIELQYILPEWVPPLPGASVAIDDVVALPDGRMLLQFESVAGRLYAIEYCPDFPSGEWLAVPMRLHATANRTQWIDAGPPATQPFVLGQIRVYRVKEVME